MKKVLFGAILGAAATAIIIKMNDEGKFDGLYENANRLIDKTKARARETWEYTQDEAEYMAEKARQKADYYERIARERAAMAARKVEEFSGDFAERMEDRIDELKGETKKAKA